MGSTSDWETMKESCDVLDELNVSYEKRVVSAHRTPEWMAAYATQAEGRGLQIIIAGAGGAAHLPGMVAAQTLLPVIGVPVNVCSGWTRFFVVNCADAAWSSGCYIGHWRSWRAQCRITSRANSRQS